MLRALTFLMCVSAAGPALLLALLVLALWRLPASADVLEGKVVGIGDRDTITLLDSNRQQHSRA